jgi:uncharacterized membrane protein YphA (DoxX/SURF4 family)
MTISEQRSGAWQASLVNRLLALRQRLEGAATSAVRFLVGLMWLANVHWKVPPDFGQESGSGLYKYSASVTRHSPFPPFTWVTREIILPNFRAFGWFTLLIEVAIAALLLIGYRIRIAALLGAGMAVPIMLSVLYYDRADEWSWAYLLMIGVHLMIWAHAADDRYSVDAALRGDRGRALRVIGAVAAAVGVLGLIVARSVDFAGDRVKLLGSDAGFINDAGTIVRRWELKFLWFNPLWALLTIALGVVLFLGARRVALALVASAGFAVLTVVMLVSQTFDYVRSDGSSQLIGTGANVAFFAGLALAGFLLGRPRIEPIATE